MTKRSVSRADNAVKILMEEEIARLAMFNFKNKFTDLKSNKNSHLLPPTIRYHNEAIKKTSYTPKMNSKSPRPLTSSRNTSA